MVLLVQEMKDLQRKFHLKLLSEQKGLDNEIKGIKIIEVENMEKYIEEEKYFLQVFSYMKVVQFLSMKHIYKI